MIHLDLSGAFARVAFVRARAREKLNPKKMFSGSLSSFDRPLSSFDTLSGFQLMLVLESLVLSNLSSFFQEKWYTRNVNPNSVLRSSVRTTG